MSPQPMVMMLSLSWAVAGSRTLEGLVGDVDADLVHRGDGDGVDLVSGFGAGGADLDPAAGEVA